MTDTTPATASAYDGVAYPAHAHAQTHPAHLATVAALYGLDAPAVGSCRVLELGCGGGSNLVPMACQYPDASFVGIDLSGRAIDSAAENAAACRLENVDFRQADIMDIGADWGGFDYIIAHGVYSWVPAEVREKILAILHENLSPSGVGLVSYNAYPGSHLRNLTRDIMLFHARFIDDPRERIRQARAVLSMVAEGSNATKTHGIVVRDQLARVERMPDELLFHDDLLEIAAPFLLHQVVSDAERHGLQYLSDASLSRRDLSDYPETVRNILASFPEAEFAARDQYHDFIDGHGFRNTLLCHADVVLDRHLAPDCIRRFFLASSVWPASDDIDPASPDAVAFKSEKGGELVTDSPLVKAALLELRRAWPQALRFDELLKKAAGPAGVGIESATERAEQSDVLSGSLLQAVSAGHLEIHRDAPGLTTRISAKPKASLWARKQSETRSVVTNLRHRAIRLEDEKVRRFMRLVDGTREVDDLVRDFAAAAANEGTDPDDLNRASVERNLRRLAELALLVA